MKNYIYSVVVISVLAFVTWYSKTQHNAGYAQCVSEYESRANTETQTLITERNGLQIALNNMAQELVDARTQKPDITPALRTHIADNNSCDYSVDAVSLLNNRAAR